MTNLAIQPPYPVFPDIDGNPLEAGYIYIGLPNLDPEIPANQIAIYFDAALTLPAAQPLRTLAGFISNAGTPANVFTNYTQVSITVRNKNGSLVYSSASETINNLVGSLALFDSISAAASADLSLFSTVTTQSFLPGWQGTVQGPKGGANYHLDGTNGAASTLYSDNSGFFDANGNGYSLDDLGTVNPYQFGCVGASANDETEFHYFADYVMNNSLIGEIPGDIFRISSTIESPPASTAVGWKFVGFAEGTVSSATSTIEMATDDIPIFSFGNADVSLVHSVGLYNLAFDYVNDQAGNTNANPIYFRCDTFNITLNNIDFNGGYWGIKSRSGTFFPWGCNWDNLDFRAGIKGGAIDSTGTIGGAPNNVWGRIGINTSNMAGGCVLKNIIGTNSTISSIELFGSGTGNLNQQIMTFRGGAYIEIGTLKCEFMTIDSGFTSNELIFLPAGGHIYFGNLVLTGTTCVLTPSSRKFLLSGTPDDCQVGYLKIEATAAVSNFYISGLQSSPLVIDFFEQNATNPTPLADNGGTVAPNWLTVKNYENSRLSDDKGDADYVYAIGEPTNIRFETALTAARFVDIPADNFTVFNGLTYNISSKGAVNGANTLGIRFAGVLKHTLTADSTHVTFKYRRSPTAHNGMIIVDLGAC